MKGRLIDSDVVIDVLRGRREARARLRPFLESDGELCCSTITKAEVLAGAHDQELSFTLNFLKSFTWIPPDEAIAERAGELARAYKRSHSGIDIADYLIAGTAQELGLELWTHNVKHFPMFKGLEPAY